MSKPQKKIPDNHYKLFIAGIIAVTILLTVTLGLYIQGSSNVAKEEVQKEETRIESESEVRKNEIILEYMDATKTK